MKLTNYFTVANVQFADQHSLLIPGERQLAVRHVYLPFNYHQIYFTKLS